MLVVVLHTRPVLESVILGTKIEGGVLVVLLALWAALVAVVSDTRHGLATDPSGSVSNGNLYYFSWGGLAMGVALMLSYIRSVWGFDVTTELQNRAKRLQYWVWLVIIGLVQMGSSARLFDNHCGKTNYGIGVAEMGSVAFCRRCQLGIALGIVTAIASLAVSVIKMGMTSNRKVLTKLFTTEMFLSGVLVVWQAIGVAFITSQTGPGAPLNNLWYSSWGSLVLGIILVASCVEDWSAAKGALKEAGSASVRDGSSTVFGDEGESLARTQPVGAAGSVSRFSQAQTMGTAYVSQEQSQTSSLYLT